MARTPGRRLTSRNDIISGKFQAGNCSFQPNRRPKEGVRLTACLKRFQFVATGEREGKWRSAAAKRERARRVWDRREWGLKFENWLPVFQDNFKHRYHRISLFLGRNTTFPVSEFPWKTPLPFYYLPRLLRGKLFHLDLIDSF